MLDLASPQRRSGVDRAMANFLRGLIFWPLLAAAIVLAIANRRFVPFSFDPVNTENPAVAFDVPVFGILMAGVLIGIVAGGLSAWSDQAHWRRKARQYRQQLAHLEAQMAAAKPAGATALVPAPRS
jgi:uncharacterized integral membrane protein